MASGKSKTIEEINILDMAEVMDALGISGEGLRDLDDMKARVKTELLQSAEKPSWAAGEAFHVLTEARDEDARKREDLLETYSATWDLLQNMDEDIISLLQKNVGNIQEKIEHHKAQLERKEYLLLVAGETSSGKSSLINLILGEKLLPYTHLSTTSTICELRYGNQPRIVAHFKDKDPETGLPAKEVFLKAASSEQGYLEQIYPYVHVESDREKGSIYKKVELFWPHQLLEKGVVIIDSPGIGESNTMDDVVTHYLPEAFAFIYVINSANAGGVQKDRLPKLLDKVRKVNLEEHREVSVPSQCALFVCNKWEQIPEKEEQKVQIHVAKKLKQCWPGLDPKSQIIYMSTKIASRAQNFGIITEEFFTLMSGMKSMVLETIKARLKMHWRWLDHLLSRIIYQAKAFVTNASRDQGEVYQRMDSIICRLKQIETKEPKAMKELRNHMKASVKSAVHELSEYLKSDDVKRRFTAWTLGELPEAESSWDVTNINITKVLQERLRETIEHWEEDKQIFSDARKSLIQRSQQWYNIVEGQLRNLQCAATNDDFDIPEPISPKGGLTTTEKVAIAVTSPLWVPVSIVTLLIGTPVVGVLEIINRLEERIRLEKYKRDKCAFMAKASEDYLVDAATESVLKVFVEDQVKEVKLCLEKIEDRIPELIEADKMLYKELGNVGLSQKEVQKLYQPIMDKASDIRGHLAVFALNGICVNDISSDELDWKEEVSSHLGCGQFATVYQGKMRRQGEEDQAVALKVCRKELVANNAISIMEEVQHLRKLDHPHIVKFYGTSLLKKEGTARVILVMEKCKGNLKSHIFDHPEVAPAKAMNSDASREVFRWAKEITDALAFIHNQGVVHRDLKLENILLSEDNSVRITDVGVSKDVEDITGTLEGTPVYIAPEVFHFKLYDSKADMYSFGIMLWEMWYGRHAFAEFSGPVTALFNFVDGGHRPKHVEGSKEPPAHWKKLMSQCWDGNPENRPPAEICLQEITAVLSDEVVGPLTQSGHTMV